MLNSNESGRSMVEMLGVLAIIGVLSVGGIAGYSKAMNKYKINKTADQVSMIVANLRTLFSTQGNYGTLDTAAAITYSVVPEDMVSSDRTALTNAFKGSVTIAAAYARSTGSSISGSKKNAFVLYYGGLSQEACITLATGDWGSGQSSGLIGIAAGKDTDIASAVDALFVDDISAANVGTGRVVAAPGGSIKDGDNTVSVAVPITVANAVTACADGETAGSGYGIAWKYY